MLKSSWRYKDHTLCNPGSLLWVIFCVSKIGEENCKQDNVMRQKISCYISIVFMMMVIIYSETKSHVILVWCSW